MFQYPAMSSVNGIACPTWATGSELAHVGLEVEHRHPVDGIEGLHCDRQVADLQQTADRTPEPVGTALGVLRPWATPSCHADAELRSARPRGACWSDALGGGPASSNQQPADQVAQAVCARAPQGAALR